MDLMENIPNNNPKKVTGIKIGFIIVVILIILLIIAAGAIWIYSQQILSSQFKFDLDGKRQSNYSESLFVFQNDKVYISIRDIAPLLGYNVYNGGYGEYTEDKSKCYVNNSKEIVSFETNSDKIYKYSVTSSGNSEGQSFDIDSPILSSGSNMYISSFLCSIYHLFSNAFDGKYSKLAHPACTLPVSDVTFTPCIKSFSFGSLLVYISLLEYKDSKTAIIEIITTSLNLKFFIIIPKFIAAIIERKNVLNSKNLHGNCIIVESFPKFIGNISNVKIKHNIPKISENIYSFFLPFSIFINAIGVNIKPNIVTNPNSK